MSRRAYAKYKDSGVEWLGKIPSQWQIKPLFSLIRERKEKNLGTTEGNVLSLSYGKIVRRDVENNFGLLPESFETYQIVDAGNIILRLTDLQNDKRSLRVGLVQEKGIITSAYVCLENGKTIDSRYASYLLHSYDISKVFYSYGGGVRQSMKYEDLKWLPIVLPPEDEQCTIAAFLDRETGRIDALIEKKQRQIELLKEKRATLISHAVTKGLDPNTKMKDSGIEWLSEIPEHWMVLQLRRVVKRFVDYRGRTPAKKDNGIPLITAGAVKNGLIDHSLAPEYIAEEDYEDWMCRGLPDLGDVVITTEAPLAEVAQVRDIHVAFAQRIILFKVNHDCMTPEFLRFYYLSGNGRAELLSRASGSTASGIRSDRLRMSLVIVPPLDEQHSIIEYLVPLLTECTVPIERIEYSIEKLREYRTALISAAVTGKIDVRGE